MTSSRPVAFASTPCLIVDTIKLAEPPLQGAATSHDIVVGRITALESLQWLCGFYTQPMAWAAGMCST